jgi:hypothetical protein
MSLPSPSTSSHLGVGIPSRRQLLSEPLLNSLINRILRRRRLSHEPFTSKAREANDAARRLALAALQLSMGGSGPSSRGREGTSLSDGRVEGCGRLFVEVSRWRVAGSTYPVSAAQGRGRLVVPVLGRGWEGEGRGRVVELARVHGLGVGHLGVREKYRGYTHVGEG